MEQEPFKWNLLIDVELKPDLPGRKEVAELAGMFGLSDPPAERLYDKFELAITAGEVIAVVGASGSGKSILLEKVRLQVPDAICLEMDDLRNSSQPAVECLEGGTAAQRLAMLSRFGLAEAACLVTPASRLSGGQIHRLALARAAYTAQRRGKPALVLADEFASVLDMVTARMISWQIRQLTRGTNLAVLLATPRRDILSALAPERVLVKELGQPARWEAPPRTRMLAPSRWAIERGNIGDYHRLAGFHYIAGPPAAHKRVYVVRPPVCWAGPDRQPAAVMVISPPVLHVRGRNAATAGRYEMSDRRLAAGRLNREVECISRVVVHPAYRSCGLAVRLVRHALAEARTPVTEALAVMGRVHPMFERAGMDAWIGFGHNRPYVYYINYQPAGAKSAKSDQSGGSKRIVATADRRGRGSSRSESKNFLNSQVDLITPTSPQIPADRQIALPGVVGVGDLTENSTLRTNGFEICPTNPRELQALVQRKFGILVPGVALCPGHQSPLDYLTASFLGQQDLLVWANRGGGKTLMAAVATVLDAVFRAPVKIRVLGGSFDQSDHLADYIRELLEAHPDLLDKAMTKSRVRLLGGSEIRMLAQSQRAVRGQHVQKIRCDEVDLFDRDVWRAVQFATRSAGKSRGSIEVLSTLHRPGGLMQELVNLAAQTSPAGRSEGYRMIRWCLWEVIENCPPIRRCDQCLLADDCRGIARRAEGFFSIDDAISIMSRSSRVSWEAEMLCRGVQREWLVFNEFESARHVAHVAYCPDWPTYRAIDFGYRSPLVCLWIQTTPNGAVHVIDEYVRARLPLDAHAREILRKDPGPITMTFVDPAGRQRESTSGSACTEMLSAGGIPCAWRSSTIAEGIELVRSALCPAGGPAMLMIDARCQKLIEAMSSYHFPPPGTADDDKPVKDGPDHLTDALRYFFINRMRPRISVGRARY